MRGVLRLWQQAHTGSSAAAPLFSSSLPALGVCSVLPHRCTPLRLLASKVAENVEQPFPEEEEDPQVKTGWVLKGLIALTLAYGTYNAVPIMGDSLVNHSVALCRAKDPFFQRSGASRLHLIATNERRRANIVEAGGIAVLLQLLTASNHEATLREAAKALANLAQSEVGVRAMLDLGAKSALERLAFASEDALTREHAAFSLERLQAAGEDG